ncbi:hypothetical protein STEG23_024363 [Scotinomys teguina]
MSPLFRRLLLAALLQLARTQAPVSQFDGPSHQKKVVSWMDVYARATCQPREVVVPLSMELMGNVVKQLVPSCVTVQRCGGCCPDDGLECVPTGQHQVRMQILMIQYPSSHLGEMSLEEHSQCECRPKQKENAVKPYREGSCACRDMRLSWVLTILSICLSALATATGAEGKRKLQIGVKKRVDHCPIKSRKGDVLHMHYTGKLDDGTEFDSSLPQNQPFVFSLGTGQVIKGWDQGLLGMCEGEKRKLVIPSELGYGERGAPPKIPGGATLVFEVELLKIERRSEL